MNGKKKDKYVSVAEVFGIKEKRENTLLNKIINIGCMVTFCLLISCLLISCILIPIGIIGKHYILSGVYIVSVLGFIGVGFWVVSQAIYFDSRWTYLLIKLLKIEYKPIPEGERLKKRLFNYLVEDLKEPKPRTIEDVQKLRKTLLQENEFKIKEGPIDWDLVLYFVQEFLTNEETKDTFPEWEDLQLSLKRTDVLNHLLTSYHYLEFDELPVTLRENLVNANILLVLRMIEIEAKMSKGRYEQSSEFLEWDINTLRSVIYEARVKLEELGAVEPSKETSIHSIRNAAVGCEHMNKTKEGE